MKKHQKDAESALVKFLDRRGHFSASDVGLQEEEMVNEKLMGDVPPFLSLNQ